MNVKNIGVAGAGAMGLGIAQVFAQSGFNVVLFDMSQEQLNKAKTTIEKNLTTAVSKNKLTEAAKKATLEKISYSVNVDSLKADLIIEAIVEKLAVKRELFEKLVAINSSHTILVSNTSSIPITQIANGMANAGRIAGMHFFNPAHIMKLVELISGAETTAKTIDVLKQITLSLKKIPILCSDSPGFITNRVARHYYVEALKILEENVATVEAVDTLMESAGFKMGPFKLMDHVGNDINFAVTSSLFESFHNDSKFRPSRIQQQKVDAGHLGKKTGKGFYNYS